MKRIVFCAILAVSAAAPLAGAGLPAWARLTTAQPLDRAVPFSTVQQVADLRAKSMWPDARAFEVVPYVDIDGNAIAYMFHYRTDGRPFPDYATAAADAATEQGLLADPRYRSKYAHVLASARFDRAPILRYGAGSTEIFLTLEQARVRAREALGTEPILNRVYYVWPLSYFEFTAGARSIVIEAHTLRREFTSDEFRERVRDGIDRATRLVLEYGDEATLAAGAAARMKQEWDRCLTDAGAFETTAVCIPGYELAPFYDWSYGCSPTSGTIVVGYLDIARGYGRNIYDFFQRYDPIEAQMDFQIPWAQRDVAIAFHTDTTSGNTYPDQIGPGLQSFGSDRGYDWDVFQTMGSYYNDWCWASDSDELSNGNPMVWSISWETHSLAAFGFRVPSKDIYVHNTWWRPAEWWHYTDGSRYSDVSISSVHARGDTAKLRLLRPLGDTLYAHNGSGELLWVGNPEPITWNNYGQPRDSVSIDLSTDGGWTWQNIAHGEPDDGSYAWNLPPETPQCSLARVRLKAFGNGQYAAGDGSYGNFRIRATPLGPLPKAPPNSWPITNPPVVLVVDTTSGVDSFYFAVDHNADTIFRSWGTARTCTVPTGLLEYNQAYGWRCRAHNSYGWGDFSTRWSFRIRFSGVEEEPQAAGAPFGLAARQTGPQTAEIDFSVPSAFTGELAVRNATGRRVATLTRGLVLFSGRQNLVWHLNDDAGRPVAGGCYFITLRCTDRAGHSTRMLQAKLALAR